TSVHLLNGVWGTLAVGLFARYGEGDSAIRGLFYGGGLRLLGVQSLGILAVGAWTVATTLVLFLAIKKTVGLRVTAEEEKIGLDFSEHATSAYPEWER
ncbi:MAG TPA: hypothetical protein PLU93_06400, partial [Treponemataceae bacterium]|nr:hypothetical protein [Treponemataceae bacterium]